YGIVFCEASAYGLPSITTDTGGVSGVVTNGVNGYTLPPEDRGEAYGKLIYQLLENRENYLELRTKTRLEYDTRLNWRVWGEKVVDEMRTLLAAK
ncbi:MAG: glycosyltransferase, partial [Candidatus Omnitrophica bacterium]|nr:glycosyltransferase [Candidatus Omnitrophota bacterium]